MTLHELENYLRATFAQEGPPIFLRFIYSDGTVIDWTFPPRLSGQNATSTPTRPQPAPVLPAEAPATAGEEPLSMEEIMKRFEDNAKDTSD